MNMGYGEEAKDYFELLIYQTSFDTSSSAELTLGQLKSGLSRKKTFETRPLSLPGSQQSLEYTLER